MHCYSQEILLFVHSCKLPLNRTLICRMLSQQATTRSQLINKTYQSKLSKLNRRSNSKKSLLRTSHTRLTLRQNRTKQSNKKSCSRLSNRQRMLHRLLDLQRSPLLIVGDAVCSGILVLSEQTKVQIL